MEKNDIKQLKEFLFLKEEKERTFQWFVEKFPPNLMVKGSKVYNAYIEMLEEQKELIEKEQELLKRVYGDVNIKNGQ
jgi:hypothetical protein